MATAEHVTAGILAFAETEIFPALPAWKMSIAYAGVLMLSKKADALAESITSSKVVSALGLIREDGSVDIEGAASALKASIAKHGKIEVDIPIIGTFRFSEQNVDTLMQCIEKASDA